MVPGWSRTLVNMYGFSCRSISRVVPVEVPIVLDSIGKSYAATSEGQGLEHLLRVKWFLQVNLNKMFRNKPISLALPPGSPHRINEPNYKGIRLFILRLMLFYSKHSTSIRAANVIYRRVVSQVENPLIYDVFRLEKTFRTTFCMLVVHMWLCLRRLKVEGKDGVELGQYVYEIFNHDLEIRVSKAGIELSVFALIKSSIHEPEVSLGAASLSHGIEVNLLLSKWMRELEKIFYGNVVAYDIAMLPEAKPDELHNAIWKNVFSNDGSPTFDAAALPAVLAFSRYVRRECICLSLTDKESMFSGNFMFTTIYNPNTPV